MVTHVLALPAAARLGRPGKYPTAWTCTLHPKTWLQHPQVPSALPAKRGPGTPLSCAS